MPPSSNICPIRARSRGVMRRPDAAAGSPSPMPQRSLGLIHSVGPRPSRIEQRRARIVVQRLRPVPRITIRADECGRAAAVDPALARHPRRSAAPGCSDSDPARPPSAISLLRGIVPRESSSFHRSPERHGQARAQWSGACAARPRRTHRHIPGNCVNSGSLGRRHLLLGERCAVDERHDALRVIERTSCSVSDAKRTRPSALAPRLVLALEVAFQHDARPRATMTPWMFFCSGQRRTDRAVRLGRARSRRRLAPSFATRDGARGRALRQPERLRHRSEACGDRCDIGHHSVSVIACDAMRGKHCNRRSGAT